jgi:uncharacterized caspase-like protein
MSDLLKKSLNREAIQSMSRKIKTNNSVLILDTCRAGAMIEARGVSEKNAIEKLAILSGRVILAASNSDEMALEGYGAFTYILLEGLQAADSDQYGNILIASLAQYIQVRLPELTSQQYHYRQMPSFVSVLIAARVHYRRGSISRWLRMLRFPKSDRY